MRSDTIRTATKWKPTSDAKKTTANSTEPSGPRSRTVAAQANQPNPAVAWVLAAITVGVGEVYAASRSRDVKHRVCNASTRGAFVLVQTGGKRNSVASNWSFETLIARVGFGPSELTWGAARNVASWPRFRPDRSTVHTLPLAAPPECCCWLRCRSDPPGS